MQDGGMAGGASGGYGGGTAYVPVRKKLPIKRIAVVAAAAVFLVVGGIVTWWIVWNMGGVSKEAVIREWGEGNESVLRLDEFFAGVWSGQFAADEMLYDDETMERVWGYMSDLGAMYAIASGYDHMEFGDDEENQEFLEMGKAIVERYEKYTVYMKDYEEFRKVFGPEVVSFPYEPSGEALEFAESDSPLRARAARGAIAYYQWESAGAKEDEYPEESNINYVGIFFRERPVLPEVIFNGMRDMLLRWGRSE